MSGFIQFLMPVISVALIAFGTGVFVGEYQVPPYRFISNGAKTLYYSVRGLTAPPYLGQFKAYATGVSIDDAETARFTSVADPTAYPGTILVNGGLNEFLELCPDDGCLGVEIDRSGAVVHAYPYRPDAIYAADMLADEPLYREAVPADPRLIFRPLGLRRYDNGDLLVVFQSVDAMFPFASGVARVDRDGQPVWFRFDYSHHWATMRDDGTALVPDLDVVEADMVVPIGPRGRKVTLECHTGRPQVDGIHVIAPDGSVQARYDIATALLESPWAAFLAETTDPCDPLHINFADTLDDTAPGGALMPGNIVISLRNLSAVAVFDPATEEITAVLRGGFSQQHAVQQLTGSKVLMFDNWGGDSDVGPVSRLMELDLATGAERRVFPQPDTPQDAMQVFSDRGSFVDISEDGSRALISYSGDGRGFEVDVETGNVILQWDSLHDLSTVPGATDQQKRAASRAGLYGMVYLDG